MIVFELICAAQHRFEGWFASGDDFEQQRRRGLLACPICATGRIAKLPTAKLGRSAEPAGPEARVGAAAREQHGSSSGPGVGAMVAAFVDYVLQNTEDVGRAFPDAARRIHRDEAARRGIRGTATPAETDALREEGIAVVALPIPPREEFH